MQRLLDDAEKLTGTHYELGNFADMTDAIHAVQTEMGITGTTAKEAATTIEGSINMTKGAWENFVTGLADSNADMEKLTGNLVDSALTAAGNIVPRIAVILTTVGQTLVEKLPGIVEQLKSCISEQGPPLLAAAGALFNQIVLALLQLAPQLMSTLPEILSNVLTAINDEMPLVLESAGQMFAMIGQALIDNGPQIISMLASTLTSLIMFIAEHIPEMLDMAFTLFGTLVQAVVDNAPQILAALGELLLSLIAYIGGKVMEFFSAAAGMMGGVLDGLLSIDIGAEFLNVLNGLVESASGIWDSICSTASNAWENIKSAIMTPINSARDAVSGAIDAIKGFFSFEIKWPNIPLPHFGINPEGWQIGDLLKGSLPSLAIDWYAKAMDDGMIMNRPTVFGVNPDGQPMAGGEAGSETVVGTDSLMSMISDASNGDQLADLLVQILCLLRAFMSGYGQTVGRAIRDNAPGIDDKTFNRMVWKAVKA